MKRFAWMLLPVAAACAAPGDGDAPGSAARAASPPQLAGTRWTGVVEPGTDAAVVPRLEFTESRLHGFTGCNMMAGAWRLEGNEVRFGGIAATRRACIGPGGDIERRVLAAMGDRSRVRREGDRLVIEAPDGARFEFVLMGSG